MAKTSPLEPL